MFKLSLSCILFTLPLSAAQQIQLPVPYTVEEVSFKNAKDGNTLGGTLTIPAEKPCAIAILIAGYGPNDRDETTAGGHKPLLILADALTRHSIATLRYDKRGVGSSEGNFPLATIEDFASDALAAVAFLKSRGFNAPLGLIGHSEGGMTATIAATETKNVSFVVLLAAPAVPGVELVKEQTILLGRASGQSPEETESSLKMLTQFFSLLTHESDITKAQSKIEALPVSPEMKAKMTALNTTGFRYFLAYDPTKAFKKLKIPVLALSGDKDWIVSVEQNFPPLQKALEEAGNKHYTLKILPGLNHLFQTCKTGEVEECASIDETMSPAALDTITAWITKQCHS